MAHLDRHARASLFPHVCSSLTTSSRLISPPRAQIEPTESEGLRDIDAFCDAMIKIRQEIDEIADGKQPRGNNTITNAPHTQQVVISSEWDRCVSSLSCSSSSTCSSSSPQHR